MKPIIVLENVLCGGLWYEPRGTAIQMVPDAVADHLVQIGVARAYEAKVIEVTEVKKKADDLPASQPGPVSPETTAKRRGRPPKSSSQ